MTEWVFVGTRDASADILVYGVPIEGQQWRRVDGETGPHGIPVYELTLENRRLRVAVGEPGYAAYSFFVPGEDFDRPPAVPILSERAGPRRIRPELGPSAVPFRQKTRYRVRRDFSSIRDTFRAGEVLTYFMYTYDVRDARTYFFFTQQGASSLKMWDCPEAEYPEEWRELFEEVP